MKSLMLLWQELLNELGSWCDICTTQDRKTALRRFEHEGLSFFTITLPTFSADLQKGLADGKVDHDLWTGFRSKGGLPLFLGGFLDLVFDRSSGVLLDEPSKDAIFAIRQITLFVSKLFLPSSDARKKKAFDSYIKCEQELRSVEREWSSDDIADFSRVGRLLFGPLFAKVDEDIYKRMDRPKHGPGASAERVGNNARFRFAFWTERLEEVFGAVDFIIPNARYYSLLRDVQFLEPGAEIPVRVIAVPKTQKTPRIIAIEPSHMMYVQKAISEGFIEHWSRDDILNQFSVFRDQVPNQVLALKGSLDESLATLDLSEASDRVSNQLVRALTHDNPFLHGAIDAARSRKADVPGHGVIRLSKFASMGSDLTFPIEMCVFLTCIFLGIEKDLNTPLTRRIIQRFAGSVRIFGDDIIVPKDHVASVVSTLEHFGAKVNSNKSYWNGKFRESCGKEYYDGFDVSVVKLRQMLPTQRQHAKEVLALSSTRNQLYQLGLWKTCAWLDDYLVRLLGRYPVVSPTSSVVGRHTCLGYYETTRGYHRSSKYTDLHAPLVKGYVASSRSPIDILDGEAALLKFFVKRGFKPYDVRHLERAGRPDAVNLKLRWASPT